MEELNVFLVKSTLLVLGDERISDIPTELGVEVVLAGGLRARVAPVTDLDKKETMMRLILRWGVTVPKLSLSK